MGIRNAAKALIIDNGKILINKNQNTLGDMCYGLQDGAVYYDLPGGGQNQYETLEEAVIRECLEETGYTVIVERLAALYEEISTHERFRAEYGQYAHKVFFIFVCRLAGMPFKPPLEKDLDMLGSVWVNISETGDIPLYPEIINKNLKLILKSEHTVYLGSMKI